MPPLPLPLSSPLLLVRALPAPVPDSDEPLLPATELSPFPAPVVLVSPLALASVGKLPLLLSAADASPDADAPLPLLVSAPELELALVLPSPEAELADAADDDGSHAAGVHVDGCAIAPLVQTVPVAVVCTGYLMPWLHRKNFLPHSG